MNQQPWQNNAPQTQQGQNTQMNDQELAFDLLYQEKSIMNNIASEVVEASHQGLRQVLNNAFMQIGQDQLNVFQIMSQNAWYQTKPAQAQDLQTAKQKYTQMRGTL